VSAAGLGTIMVHNLGRVGPIPQSAPGHTWTPVLLGATLWALVSVLVAAESARGEMRWRT
jgi:hypothetical protein